MRYNDEHGIPECNVDVPMPEIKYNVRDTTDIDAVLDMIDKELELIYLTKMYGHLNALTTLKSKVENLKKL